jgi:hypothetical protein
MIEGVWPHVREDDWCGQWLSPARVAAAQGAQSAPHGTQPGAQGTRTATVAVTSAAPVTPSTAPPRAPATPARPSMITPLPAGAIAAGD